VPGSGEPFSSVPTEPLPVLADVLRLVEDFRAKGMNVDTVAEVALEDVDRGVGLTAYRVVQEALTNALKHAPGADVTVRVTGDADRVALEVTDRGGRSRVGPGTGFGLLGLRERVALYGGRLSAGPTDLGWRLEVELPRRPAGRSADRLPAASALVEEVAE
jgi:signal transduction histidine kinase